MSSGSTKYAESGVDEPREQSALQTMLRAFVPTLAIRRGVGSPITEADHFGSLIDLGHDLALSIATDGVGTKLMIAQDLKRYEEIAHDLVANNVNDILCMGGEPIAIVDYIGIDVADEEFLGNFARSMAQAALEARISIVGGEIAQIGQMLNPAHGSPRFDVVATVVGLSSLKQSSLSWPCALDRRNVAPGDILIGISSSGLHSNGFSLARKALFQDQRLAYFDTPNQLGGLSVADALLTPTKIYVSCILPLLKANLINGLANISGGGLLTIARLNPSVSFEIEHLPPAAPIFDLIIDAGRLSHAEAFSTFNMGLGMVIATSAGNVEQILAALNDHGEQSWIIGRVASDMPPGTIRIACRGLIGKDHEFRQM